MQKEIRYGSASLSDIMPSALAALGLPGDNPLQIEPTGRIVLLLIDGLGWNALREHAADAPFLSSLAGASLTAGFPTTTATSIASIGTGLPSGQHGITGFTSRVTGAPEPINWLGWRTAHSGQDLLEAVPPEAAQPFPTAFQRAEDAGIAVSVVNPHAFARSGLTRAVLRGGTYRPIFTAADTATVVAEAAAEANPSLVYCYYSEVDLLGHACGAGTDAWRVQLALADRAAELLAERLPPGTTFLVTADHGMVNIAEESKVDFDAEPSLAEGVDRLAGEARVRYLHVADGQLDAVRDRWRARVGDAFEIVERDDAIARGWYGPTVTADAYGRIGDLIAIATADGAIVRTHAEPRLAAMIGQHGALTDDELLVPLLRLTR